MIIKKSREKGKELSYKVINIGIICIVIVDIIALIGLICIISVNNKNIDYNIVSKDDIKGIISLCNTSLSIIATFCCSMYYYIYKKDYLYFFTQIYLIFSLEYIVVYFWSNANDIVGTSESIFLFLLYLYTTIIISYIALSKKDNKIKNDKKDIFAILNIGITMVLLIVMVESNDLLNINFNMKIINLLSIILIVYNFCVSIILAIKSIKEHEFMYIIFFASLNMLCLKKIYQILYNISKSHEAYCISIILSFFSFIIIIFGLFVEMFLKNNESEIIKSDLITFYESLENNNNGYIIIYDNNYNILYANRAMREKECNVNDSLEKQYERLEKISIFKKNYPIVFEIKYSISKNGRYTGIIRLKNGRVYRAELHKLTLENSERIVATYTDITEEYEATQKLIENENKLKAITENILDIIVTIDDGGKITYINASGLRISGYELNEVIGRDYNELINESNREINRLFVKKYNEENIMFTHGIIAKDGRIIEVETIVKRLVTQDSNTGYLAVSRDLQWGKKIEELTDKYNEILEQDTLRSEFFANLSHELRTPINIIHSCLQLLNNQKANGVNDLANYYNKYEGTIKQNCYRLLRLVNNIIDISKIDAGFSKLNFRNYDIINLVEEITMSVVPYVEEKDMSIMFDTDTEELQVKCDPDMIERVMLNLISNAVKFSPKGGLIIVDIKVDVNWVNIRVVDTGIGIPKGLNDAIFERFVQNDKSFNREKEGSGIGLALVKSIVLLHSGKVFVEESSNSGTVFCVKLPNVVCDSNKDDSSYGRETAQKSLKERIGIEFSDIYDIN